MNTAITRYQAPVEPLRYEQNSAFAHSLWARWEYLTLMAMSSTLQNQHTLGYAQIGYSLVQDAYYALKGGEPNLSPAGKAWGEVINQDYFPTLQDMMDNGDDAKINTIMFLAKRFYDHYLKKDESKPTPGAMKRALNKFQKQQTQRKKDQEDRQQGGDQPPQQMDSGIQEALDQLSDQAQGEEGEGDTEPSEQAGPQFGAAIDEEVEALEITEADLEELDQQNEVFSAMAGIQAGTGAGPNELREFTEDMYQARKISGIERIIGFGKRVMEGAKRKNVGATGEFVGYGYDTFTKNVHPADRMEVLDWTDRGMAKLADRKLRNRKMDEKKPSGMGAAIYMHDESSSMVEDGFNNPDGKRNQSINLQIALAHLFKSQGRPFTAIAWDDDQTRLYEYGTPGLQDHLNRWLGGGTSINHAIVEALDFLDSHPDYRDKADMLIVSDGELGGYQPPEDEELWERVQDYKQNGGRIWFVFVGFKPSEQRVARIERWADFCVSAEDFYDEEKLSQVFEKMATDPEKYDSYLI